MYLLIQVHPYDHIGSTILGIYGTEDRAVDTGYAYAESNGLKLSYLAVYYMEPDPKVVGNCTLNDPLWTYNLPGDEDND